MKMLIENNWKIVGRLSIIYLITDFVTIGFTAIETIKKVLINPNDSYLFGWIIVGFIGYIPYALIIFVPLSISMIAYIRKKGGRLNSYQLILPGIVNCLITLIIALLIYKSQMQVLFPDGAISLIKEFYPLYLWSVAYMVLFRFFFPEFFFGYKPKAGNNHAYI